MVSVAFYTLGCKLNQLESESIADAFRRRGFAVFPREEKAGDPPPAPEPAFLSGREPDILIINTCTVTGKAEQKARRLIRGALRDYPFSRVLVTGCYAQMEAERLEALEGEIAAEKSPARASGNPWEKRLFVIPGGGKDRLLDLPDFLADLSPETGFRAWVESQKRGPEEAGEKSFRFSPGDFSFHSRAFLKIQDGCDNRCSYCRVSLARGGSRSEEAGRVLAALKALEEKGYAEAVLTGLNISQYRDPAGPESSGKSRDLAWLLGRLLEGTGEIRLRLSSLEPDGFSPELLEVISSPRIRPHFHLSVQSGSALILEKMRRSYRSAQVEDLVRRLRTVKDDPFLACDIITGFPGETGAEFEKTRELCRGIGFAWIHAFPYSPRPGTEAWTFRGKVGEREASCRVEELSSLARNGRREYVSRWIGRELEAITEAPRTEPSALPGNGEDLRAGVTENYLKVLIHPGKGLPPGRRLRCRLRDSTALPGWDRFDALAEAVPKARQGSAD